MNKEFFKIVLNRFTKGFISGGLASITVILTTHQIPVDNNGLKTWLISDVIAFVTGGLLAVEKMLQGYQPQK